MGFVLVSVLPSAATLIGLAVVARRSSVEQWAGLGIGGSVGALMGLVVLFGWRLVGPVQVSRADEELRRALYADSLADRALLSAGGLSLGVLGGIVLAPGARELAAAMAVATCLTGLSAGWFFVGTGDPWSCLRAEVGPRVASGLAGAVAVVLGAPVVVFPLLLAAGALAGLGQVNRTILGGPSRGRVRRALTTSPARMRGQLTAATSEVLAGGYTVASVAVVGAVAAPGVTALFSAGDRVLRAALIPVSALASALQPHVTTGTGADLRRRTWSALGQHLALGLVGCVGLATLGGVASRLLFGGVGAIPVAACVAYGVAFLAIAVNTSLARHVLVPRGRTREVMLGSLGGTIVGVGGMVAGARTAGVAGAAWGLALGEIAVVAILAIAVARTSWSAQEPPVEVARHAA